MRNALNGEAFRELRKACESVASDAAARAFVLAGEGGTGKSLLARSIFEALEEEVFEASLLMMMHGTADAVSVLRRLCTQLGVDEPPIERPALLAALYEQLAIVREDGRHSVLIIDDSQVLGSEAMAEIGGLLNLEYEDRRLLSLLLVGSPDLDDIDPPLAVGQLNTPLLHGPGAGQGGGGR